MAITTRRLVEEHAYFQGDRIAFNPKSNLTSNDRTSLTSIVNLYEILRVVFTKIAPRHKLADMRYYRPREEMLDEYYQCACDYFDALKNNFDSLRRYFRARDCAAVARRHRRRAGGDVMFRPIGLLVMTEVIAKLCRQRELDEAAEIAAGLPRDLARPPYREVLWSRSAGMMTGKVLARDLLLFMLDELPAKRAEKVGLQYARALDRPDNQWKTILDELRDEER